MGIRFKIGLGFALMIVLLTSVISYWGARTLGFSLESSDLGKLSALRSEVVEAWKDEHQSLASLTSEVGAALADLDFSESGFESAIAVVEKIKRHLSLDWLEIIRDGRQQINPSIKLNAIEHPPFWPVRLTNAGPLSNRGYLVDSATIPGKKDLLIIVRKPRFLSIPMACLWDNRGILEGDPRTFPPESLIPYENLQETQQRLHKGRLFRVRTERLDEIGPYLMVGYEADVTTISRMGVNEFMVQLTILEVIGLLILGYFLGRRLFGPLEKLKFAIDRVAKGNWQEIPATEAPINEKRDEIGALARSFNHMVRELSNAQERLIQVQKELLLKEKMAALGRFSAGVAHEINNPLGTILVSAGIAKEALDKQRPVEEEDLEAIIEETKRCKNIVESLLRYAHNKPPRLQPISLKHFVETEAGIILEKSAYKNIKYTMEAIPETVAMIDPLGIGQVLRNLLENAKDAVQNAAHPEIKISGCLVDNGFTILTIWDNGEGFDGVAEHLFEPLATTKPQGTGLGLAICQSIIEGHGGRIWAERHNDGWTLFHFSLRAC